MDVDIQPIITTSNQPTNEANLCCSYLPDDIFSQIFLYLPIKSLLRFKAVCKGWKEMISDPDLAAKLLKKVKSTAPDSNSNLVLVQNYGAVSYVLISSICNNPNDFESRNLSCPFAQEVNDYHRADVLASCNGLLLVRFGSHFVWNPVTGEFRALPPMPRLSKYNFQIFYRSAGLAYDQANNDYKAVFYIDCPHRGLRLCMIHSLRSGQWRRVNMPTGIDPKSVRTIVLNGACHWISYHYMIYQRRIVALDVASEEVRNIGLPDYGAQKITSQKLWIFEECLCVISYDDTRSMYEFSVMKEYGVEESWTRLFQIPFQRDIYHNRHPEFLWCSKEGDQLLIWYLSNWTVFDTKRRSIIRSSPSPRLSIGPIAPIISCVVSLVSPNRF